MYETKFESVRKQNVSQEAQNVAKVTYTKFELQAQYTLVPWNFDTSWKSTSRAFKISNKYLGPNVK